MARVFAVAVCFGLLMVWAPSSFGSGGGWSVSGGGIGAGLVAGDRLELAAQADTGGLNVSGTAENQFTLVGSQFNNGGQVVCLTVQGNRALVLFRYRTPVTVAGLPGETFPYGGAIIEDNGNPVDGQPVDRMADFSVQEQNAQFFCDNPSVDVFAAVLQPMASGNYVVSSA
jgi:hypothetical protein